VQKSLRWKPVIYIFLLLACFLFVFVIIDIKVTNIYLVTVYFYLSILGNGSDTRAGTEIGIFTYLDLSFTCKYVTVLYTVNNSDFSLQYGNHHNIV
jgi:hypothetical protein